MSTTRTAPGLRLIEHRFEVPLTDEDDGRRIEVFAREVRAARRSSVRSRTSTSCCSTSAERG
jgi:hypothetical protein